MVIQTTLKGFRKSSQLLKKLVAKEYVIKEARHLVQIDCSISFATLLFARGDSISRQIERKKTKWRTRLSIKTFKFLCQEIAQFLKLISRKLEVF